MKYVFFTYEGTVAPIAYKLIQEGNVVEFAHIEDKEDILTEDEKKPGAGKEDPELKKRRLECYSGLINKLPAKKAIKAMADVKDKEEWFYMTDMNDSFKYSTAALKMGYENGFFPLEEDRSVEVNREEGKEIVEKNYKGIFVKDYKEFKSAKDGIAFLEGNKNIYVLKSLGDDGETVVPKGDDPELENQIIIDTLEAKAKDYEGNGFLLEQKIMDAVEFTPEIMFWNGKPIMTTVDIETKTKQAGEVGTNVGCGTNLVVRTELNDKINQICFPKFVHDFAASRKGLVVWDIGILLDKKDGKMYFTEFCPNRMGWDSFPTELSMCADGDKPVSAFFEKVAKGENPLMFKYGVGVRLFNDNKDKERYEAAGLSFTCDEKTEDIWIYDRKLEDDKNVTTGYTCDLAVVTGAANNLKDACERAYSQIKNISFKDVAYRDKDDFNSMSYSQAVMKRFSFLVEAGLIKTDDSEEFGLSKKVGLRGYDLDGVLNAGVEPIMPYVVITGRTIEQWGRTIQDIGYGAPIYLRPYGEPGNPFLSARWKIDMINKLGVEEFTEDDPNIAEQIEKECPSTKVILKK